ncbi:MAG: sulfatase-like hydrolase/transferase [Gemmataceae bacterium]
MRTILLCLILASAAPAAAPPNIVLIVSDDQGWGDYGFMGHPHVRTPYLDKLAAQSLWFPRGYVPSSLCCPSLASLITGRYPHQHKITSNDPPIPAGMAARDAAKDAGVRALRQRLIGYIDDVPTLPRLLAGRGYVSFQTGKWWQGDFKHGGFTGGMTKGDPDAGGRHGDAGLTIGRQTMAPAFDFIARAKAEGKPFFLWYAPMMPHQPHNPPERLLAKYADKAPTPTVAKYWAMVEWFDETCGQLLAELDRLGVADNTVVVYVADNGWIQEPNAARYAAKSKQSPYDGGLRTPILLRHPGRVAPQKAGDLASSIDLMPTLLAAAGVAAPAGLPGIDLCDAAARAKRDAVYGACFTHNAVDVARPASSLRWRWTVEGPMKLIVPGGTESGEPELYHLGRDPHETENLAAKEPAAAARLRGKLDAWWTP